MISGPLGLRYGDRLLREWRRAEIAAYDLVTKRRVAHWFDLAPRVGDNLFIKLYAHGALESNAAALLDGELSRLFELIHSEAERRGSGVGIRDGLADVRRNSRLMRGSRTECRGSFHESFSRALPPLRPPSSDD